MRYLVTWTSPVVFRQAEEQNAESIGVYGVEGSKPGAAAGKENSPPFDVLAKPGEVGAYLSHRVLGLHKDGYGTLLGEAVFSCARVSLVRQKVCGANFHSFTVIGLRWKPSR